ncbi:hypothetical protein CSUI_003074, partial [Cystoisospora suis]
MRQDNYDRHNTIHSQTNSQQQEEKEGEEEIGLSLLYSLYQAMKNRSLPDRSLSLTRDPHHFTSFLSSSATPGFSSSSFLASTAASLSSLLSATNAALEHLRKAFLSVFIPPYLPQTPPSFLPSPSVASVLYDARRISFFLSNTLSFSSSFVPLSSSSSLPSEMIWQSLLVEIGEEMKRSLCRKGAPASFSSLSKCRCRSRFLFSSLIYPLIDISFRASLSIPSNLPEIARLLDFSIDIWALQVYHNLLLHRNAATISSSSSLLDKEGMKILLP